MSRTIRLTLALGLVAALVFATTATAAASGRKIFSSGFVGLPTGSLVLDGLTGGGVPWSIEEGTATLTADGRLHVEVQGLVVASSGVNPVASGRAVVACAGVPVFTSDPVPFSMPDGNAVVDAQLDLSALEPCLDLAVFFTNSTSKWFAVTGF